MAGVYFTIRIDFYFSANLGDSNLHTPLADFSTATANQAHATSVQPHLNICWDGLDNIKI